MTTTEEAARMLQDWAELDSRIGLINAARTDSIARVNAQADAEAEPLIAKRAAIAASLEVWWGKEGHALAQGKRKSIELGGCLIGSRRNRISLAIAGDEDEAVKALQRRDWAGCMLRTKVSLDKPAILMSLDGVYKRSLASIGFGRKGGDETVFIERTSQAGTLG